MITTFDVLIQPRSIALSLCLLFLVFFFNNKKLFSTIPLSLSIFMQPMTSLPFLAFFYIALMLKFIKDHKINKSIIISALIPIISGILFLAGIKGNANLSLFGIISPAWEEVIRFRNPSFILDWSYTSFIYLIISLVLFTVIYYKKEEIFKSDREKKYNILMLILIPFALFILSFITVDLAKLQLFQQFQLARSLIISKMLITILFAYFAYNKIKENPKNFILNFILTGIIIATLIKEIMLIIFIPALLLILIEEKYNLSKKISFIKKKQFTVASIIIPSLGLLLALFILGLTDRIIYLMIAIALTILITSLLYKNKMRINYKHIIVAIIILIIIFIPKFTIFPKYYQDKEFMEACSWIKENTNKSDTFIAQPFSNMSGSIRTECFRPLFASGKDGGQSAFNEEYALEWKKRFNLINELSNNKNLIYNISKEYNIKYIISDSDISLDYKISFNNTKYFIYKTES